MKKGKFFIIILTWFLLPAIPNAQAGNLYCLLDYKTAYRGAFDAFCPATFQEVLAEKTQAELPLAENELSAEELDNITAGGLENLLITPGAASGIYGRIILWDEPGSRDASRNAISIDSKLPGYSMKSVHINEVFNGSE